MAAASSVQVSPLMHRHIIPPYPGPTSDVMLTSFTKRHQNPIFHIFSRKIMIFSHFYWSIVKFLCMLHHVVCTSVCKFNLWAAVNTNSSTFKRPWPYHYQVFIIFLCVPWFSKLSALKAYQPANFPSSRLCNCQFNPNSFRKGSPVQNLLNSHSFSYICNRKSLANKFYWKNSALSRRWLLSFPSAAASLCPSNSPFFLSANHSTPHKPLFSATFCWNPSITQS